jgi:hypothetical protein
MYIFHLFRSFLPFRNPVGFGASDFIELAVATLLVFCVLLWPLIRPYALKLANRTRWCMAAIAALPAVLRLALLPHCPVPLPSGSDDFAYVLLADTLLHFRLANPQHPFYRFFETIFVLQQPTYSSIYPLGQGLALAAGRALFGHPWAGVVFSVSAFCSLCYWMLLGWTTPRWALLGGVLAALEFGPLSYWMNSYWGGAVSAIAGCLVFGALPRLVAAWRKRDAALLGAGLGIQLLTRPFESSFLLLAVVLFFALLAWHWCQFKSLVRILPFVILTTAPAIALTLMQNKAVTGSWTVLPYEVSRYQYGVPPTFMFQQNALPHRQLTADQELDYRAQSEVHGKDADTPALFFDRLAYRFRFLRFFFYAPLFIALVAFFSTIRQPRFAWALATVLLFLLGANFYPYFYPHYIGSIACLFILMTVIGLDRLNAVKRSLSGRAVVRMILFLCAAQFVFWYGLHFFAGDDVAAAMSQHETWDFINYGDPEGRVAIQNQLASLPGKQLVFVRYGPRHMFHNWIHNAADIDRARIVWARDLGPEENEKLRNYYQDRTLWLVEPDNWPVKLEPYHPAALQFENVP